VSSGAAPARAPAPCRRRLRDLQAVLVAELAQARVEAVEMVPASQRGAVIGVTRSCRMSRDSFEICVEVGADEALLAYRATLRRVRRPRTDRARLDLARACASSVQHGLQITQCGGGTVPVARAGAAPLLTLDSGRCRRHA